MMCDKNYLIIGNIVNPIKIDELDVFHGFLVIENGKIKQIGNSLGVKQPSEHSYRRIELTTQQFVIPGFVDCHVHGAQFPNIGLGLDKPLLEWLKEYTFPLEKKFEDVNFAENVYNTAVHRLLKNGTTTACYYGTLNLNGTMKLVEAVNRWRQRALVGKVSMNVANDMGYYNQTDVELKETEDFVRRVKQLKEPLIEPIVTPRFALSCDLTLMKGLADIALQYDCKIQSHLSENLNEIKAVLDIYKPIETYTHVYDECGLLNNKTIMAHSIHLSENEMKLLSSRGTSVAHCPASNTKLMSGLCPVKTLMNSGIKVGLGTDVSGGDSASILDAIRRAMDVSIHRCITGVDSQNIINWKEALFLATLGGAKALNLDDKIGNFEVGKEFDALIIDTYSSGGQIDQYIEINKHADRGNNSNYNERVFIEELLQRFIYLGDDRNIVQVFVNGQIVKL